MTTIFFTIIPFSCRLHYLLVKFLLVYTMVIFIFIKFHLLNYLHFFSFKHTFFYPPGSLIIFFVFPIVIPILMDVFIYFCYSN